MESLTVHACFTGLIIVHACHLPRTAIAGDKPHCLKNVNWDKWQLVKTPSVR